MYWRQAFLLNDFRMEILFQDADYVAINKPAGLLSIRDGYNQDLPNAKSVLENTFTKVWTIHRLDKDTSGVLVFALNPTAHRQLNFQFETRKINKKYLALIHGHPPEDHFTIQFPLKINGDRKHRTIPNSSFGKEALTEINVLKTIGSCSVALVSPKTGYTHQIRSHLWAFGYPIVGDNLYKTPQTALDFSDFPRLALHAYTLAFFHYLEERMLEITAPILHELDVLI